VRWVGGRVGREGGRARGAQPVRGEQKKRCRVRARASAFFWPGQGFAPHPLLFSPSPPTHPPPTHFKGAPSPPGTSPAPAQSRAPAGRTTPAATGAPLGWAAQTAPPPPWSPRSAAGRLPGRSRPPLSGRTCPWRWHTGEGSNPDGGGGGKRSDAGVEMRRGRSEKERKTPTHPGTHALCFFLCSLSLFPHLGRHRVQVDPVLHKQLHHGDATVDGPKDGQVAAGRDVVGVGPRAEECLGALEAAAEEREERGQGGAMSRVGEQQVAVWKACTRTVGVRGGGRKNGRRRGEKWGRVERAPLPPRPPPVGRP
jgi:hypothetical protein